ncbi:MAG TPA: hypothetical protein VK625_12100, partial [Flavitalea sp.]|nr:hypothetical protein [Flavitalea sp.]
MIGSSSTKIPKLTRWVLILGLIFILVMTLMRLAIYFFFPNQGLGFGQVRAALILGLRYDLRAVSVIMVSVLIFGSIPRLSPFAGNRNRKIWLNLLGLLTFFILFFYGIDFAHFSYLNQRLNASVLNYLEDLSISLSMMWESYPIIR